MIPALPGELPASVTSLSDEDTLGIGRMFARRISRGDIVLLFGDLGSGKTKFVQGICSGFGVEEPVVSPTFTLINIYNARNGDGRLLRIHHIDCYRLESTGEADRIGIGELFGGDGICLVEWPQICLPLLTGPYWKIELERGDSENIRNIRIENCRR